jgi:hypothetical protein
MADTMQSLVTWLGGTPLSTAISSSPWMFWAKIAFILLAGVNVLLFYVSGIFQAVETLGAGEDAPRGAKAIAATSLFLWVGVMFWGRMLPFLGVAF